MLNQSNLVCEIKIQLEGNLNSVVSSERNEIHEKVKSVLKENGIEESYIEIL